VIENNLFTLLSGNSLIASLVGDRIYPVILPTGFRPPGISYQIVSGQVKAGFTTRGVQRWRLQVDCWSKAAYLEAATVRDAVRRALDVTNAQFADGTVLLGAFFIQPIDFFAGENELYRCGAEFYLHFQFPPAS
jgi:Protein of unknown function (DUF3168)